jgi:hypothetical protein
MVAGKASEKVPKMIFNHIYILAGMGETDDTHESIAAKGLDLVAKLTGGTRIPRQELGFELKKDELYAKSRNGRARTLIIGHSWGASAALAKAKAYWHLRFQNYPTIISLDHTPESRWDRFTKQSVEVDEIPVVNLRRTAWFGPLSKRVEGEVAVNVTVPGDHNNLIGLNADIISRLAHVWLLGQRNFESVIASCRSFKACTRENLSYFLKDAEAQARRDRSSPTSSASAASTATIALGSSAPPAQG